MAEIRHPQAPLELQHLHGALAVIDGESAVAEEELVSAKKELSAARRFDPDALPLREMMYASALQNVRNLGMARKRPYFTRIDFHEENGPKQIYYIGKYGVMPKGAKQAEIVDWRAPVANLYYSGQIGPMHYVAPDGEIQGELTLKRQFGIEDSTLKTIFDTDVVSQDAYLQSVLGAMTGDRLREIVTTIQAEQNYVIRYPLRASLVVQGVAGSGKTTIALHRIAYLLYAFGMTLRPEQMLILAPNPLFLNFIAGVLPDLGVERVLQTTFTLLMRDWLDKALPPCDTSDRLESVLEMDDAALKALTTACRVKGSLALGRLLDEWLDRFEDRFATRDDVTYGPCTLFTGAQIKQFLLIDEKPFPMQRRLAELKKQLVSRAKGAAKQLEQFYLEAFDRKAAKVHAQEKDPEARNDRLRKLQASRDERIRQAHDEVMPFVKKTLAEFPALEPMRLYRAFWQDMLGEGPEDVRATAQSVLKRFEKTKKIEPEDVAPIALIAMRTTELKRQDVRHIVIDEAQDFSPLEFSLLTKMAPAATYTVVGDLMQGVNGWRGLHGWDELTQGVFGSKAQLHYLVTSYRNTIEIMQAALRVAHNRPTPGQQEAKPVLRHGDEPEFARYMTDAEQAEMIVSRIDTWREKGLSSIAVIDKSPARLKTLLKKMPERLHARLLDVNQEEYDAGVLLAPTSSVKGLEFDGVIMADVSETSFRDTDLNARLLYVCLTRALHNLTCLYKGEMTPLLRREEAM